MRDQHQRLFRLQLLIQEPVHFPDRLVVHAREGFVEDEQRRAFYERAEEEDQGLVPCREGRERLFEERRGQARMVESREEVRDRLGLGGRWPPIRKDRLEAGHDGLRTPPRRRQLACCPLLDPVAAKNAQGRV